MPIDDSGTGQPPVSPAMPANETVGRAAPKDAWATLTANDVASEASQTPPLARDVPGYRLLREIGRGGMGVVYEARQEGLDRTVALKMILKGERASPEELARFQREGLAIAKLQHPNIVQVYAVGNHDGLPFFALEYCAGGTLTQRLVQGTGMELTAAANVIATLARAVHVAHQAGIIHRDLKPGNILFTKEGTAKVTDFGLAKHADSALNQTQSGVIMGTPSYMSPEQATGHTHAVAPPSDVFALGVILYEAVTGQRPFVAATPWETLQLVCTNAPHRPRGHRAEVPAELEAIILQCLDKNPANRYASAADLADDLDRWQRGEPVRAHGHSVLYRLSKRLRKQRRKGVAVAVGALLMLLFWLGLSDAGHALPGSLHVQRWLDRYDASVFRPAPADEELRAAAGDHRVILRRRLMQMAASREGWFAPRNAGPDPWTQMQGTVAVFSCQESDHAHYDKCIRRLDQVFEPTDECVPFTPGFGWLVSADGNISAEPCAWALLALAKALRLAELPNADDRARIGKRLEQVQKALENYRALDKESGRHNGGWTIFAQQVNPSNGNVYITLIVCQGLLELRRAGLPWRGSHAVRDRLLDQTLAYLVQQFDGRGWSAPSTISDQYNDGFSLQILTTLLDAEAGEYLKLPNEIVDAIPPSLAESSLHSADYQSPVTLFGASFRNHLGKAVPWAERRMRPVWYPWAVSCAARWLRRCEQVGAPHDEIVRTRRVLGHLLLTLGPTVIEAANRGEPFVSAEILIGLTAVTPP